MLDETVMDCSNDNILCENTSFDGCSTNKKMKLDKIWSWKIFIQELTCNNQDDYYQYTWNLIFKQIIQNHWLKIPNLGVITEFITRKINELEKNDFQNRKTSSNQTKKIDSFKNIYFNIIYLILKNEQDVNLITKLDKEIINKTIDYFYKQLNINESNYFKILSDFVTLSNVVKIEHKYFRLIIDKFLTLISSTSDLTNNIDPEFLKLILAILQNTALNKMILNNDLKINLIENILPLIKFNSNQSENNDIENEKLPASTFRVKENKKMNLSVNQSHFENKNKIKNFNQNFILISHILLALTEVYVRTKEDDIPAEDVQIILDLANQNDIKMDSSFEQIEQYYSKLINFDLNDKKKVNLNITSNGINFEIGKFIIDKLLDRSKQICQSNDFNLQLDVNSAEFLALNKMLLDEYFLQLNFCSNLLAYEKDLTESAIKRIKTIFNLITLNFKKMVRILEQKDLISTEKKDIISQLSFILNEIFFNFRINVIKNEKTLDLFISTFDNKLIQILLHFISLNDALELEQESSEKCGADLLTILFKPSYSIIGLKKILNEFKKAKLVAISFLGLIGVEFSFSKDNEINSIGKTTKKNLMIHFFNNYFEKKSETFSLKDELIGTKSNSFEFASIILFLNSFKHKNCSTLTWKEYTFALNIFETLIRNNYFDFGKDPIVSRLVFRILSKYASKLLMANSFLSWYEANLSQLIPNLSSQHLNALKVAYTNLEKIQDQYINLIDFIHSASCFGSNKIFVNFSTDTSCEIGRLLIKAFKIYRLKIIHFSFRIKQSDDEFNRRTKKDAAKKMYEIFSKLLEFLNTNIKNNQLKLKLREILIKNTFDRYLFRNYLNKYLQHEPSMSLSLFDEKDIQLFEIKQPFYLDCLCYFASVNEPLISMNLLQNKKSSDYLVNDEFEDNFFDKIYTKQAENHEIFDTAIHEYNSENNYLIKTTQQTEPFEEKYSKNKKMYANIRKQFDDPFFFKYQILISIKQMLSFQPILRHKRKSEIKCLFALMHLGTEFRSYFDLKVINQILTQTTQLIGYKHVQDYLNQFKVELFYQWLDINKYIDEDDLQLEVFFYQFIGYNEYGQFLNDFISDVASYCNLKSSKSDKKLTRLFHLTPNLINEKDITVLLGSNHKFALKFFSKTFLSIFLSKLNNEDIIQRIEYLFNKNLLNIDLLKKYFHFIFKEFFINSSSDYLCLENNQFNSLNEFETTIQNAVETLLNIYIKNSVDKQLKNQDIEAYKMKTLINLIQINLNDDSASTSTSQSLTSMYNILFSINEKIYSQKNMFTAFYFFRGYKIFLKCFALSNDSKSMPVLTHLLNKNNYQIFLHHFIIFKLNACVKICKDNLKPFKSMNIEINETDFYEINVFNMRFLDMAKDVLKLIVEHLEMNNLEISYFDWPISCLIWNFLDYLNLSESLNIKLEFIQEFNKILLDYLIQLIETGSKCSERFKRLSNFLTTLISSSAENNTDNKFVLMHNLTQLINQTSFSNQTKNIRFEIEINTCLNSIDLERTVSAKYILCYLSNLLVVEYKKKLTKDSLLIELESVGSIRSSLKLFINKLLNISMLDNSKDLKELACLCLSMIGPIDFKTYHLPIDKNEKYEMNYSKELNKNQRRIFILQNFCYNYSDSMLHFYFLLVENLLDYLFSEE